MSNLQCDNKGKIPSCGLYVVGLCISLKSSMTYRRLSTGDRETPFIIVLLI